MRKRIIKDYKILKIIYDGLYDKYMLFGKFCIYKTENDRDFWNDWE